MENPQDNSEDVHWANSGMSECTQFRRLLAVVFSSGLNPIKINNINNLRSYPLHPQALLILLYLNLNIDLKIIGFDIFKLFNA